ncbi:MAG: response regulator [Janthinobacterium lividum]
MSILLVDDHAIVRAGLRRLLATLDDTAIREAATGEEALALARLERPRLVVLDLNLPGISGLELLRRLLAEHAGLRVLVLSMHAEPLYAARAMEAGARGFLSKNASADEVLLAVRKVGDGQRHIQHDIAQEMALLSVGTGDPMGQLTERELEILRLLGEGRSLGGIAEALGVGYKTIANASTQLKTKLGVQRTADLVRVALGMRSG